ncbi:hypothetical protein, partial [Mesorhizobium mediterraneum]|uniref:hypothetical protein n=1 Tax=Mesorhizobium mediterraneum TaxID=43617 RepID=UPI001AEF32E9
MQLLTFMATSFVGKDPPPSLGDIQEWSSAGNIPRIRQSPNDMPQPSSPDGAPSQQSSTALWYLPMCQENSPGRRHWHPATRSTVRPARPEQMGSTPVNYYR